MTNKFLTPDAATGDTACRRVSVPIELVPYVTAAIHELTKDYNWEQFGTMTVEEAVELCTQISWDFRENSCMIGAMVPYAGTMPSNVLLCDGTVYNRVDYPRLYAVLDSSLIINADTFMVPDMRGRCIVGAGTGVGLTPRVIGASGGAENHQLTIAEIPSHDHTHHIHGPDIDLELAGVPQPVTGYALPGLTGSTGGDQAHNNMQPFFVGAWGIIAE